MSFTDLLLAEMRFVYAEHFRRKGVLLTIVAWPYMITLFIVVIGSAIGSTQAFYERLGVDPIPFFIVSSFILMTVLAVVDDIMWRPLFNDMMGTTPYIMVSPINTLLYYIAIPIPRLTLVLVLGLTSVVPVLTVYYGLRGLVVSMLILILALFAALTFSTASIAITACIYTIGGESWRVINVLRPILLILLGVFYPRWLMPLTLWILSSLLPPSHAIELIHRILIENVVSFTNVLMCMGLALALAVIYTPIAVRGLRIWESKRLREGIRL